MEIEEVVGWFKRNFKHLNLARALSYWFAWLACCTVGAFMFNAIAPSSLRWFTSGDQFAGVGFLSFVMFGLCGLTYAISKDS